MAQKDSTNTRRPLPIPQNPSSSTTSSSMGTPAQPTEFSVTRPATSPPPLPSRPKSIGTTHTSYIPPDSPPSYLSTEKSSSFREPELVAEELVMDDEPRPDLLEPTPWYSGATHWDTEKNSWPEWKDTTTDSFNPTSHPSDYSSTFIRKKIVIDGRNEDEEENWWDESVRQRHDRPGPGILPPVLADALHNPEHSLFSVSVTSPDLKPPDASATGSHTSRTGNLDLPSPMISQHTSPPPTPDDVHTAVPHPNAHYCRKHNGWVLLLWKSSSVFPPLADSFQKTSSFPDQARRKRTGSCIGEGEQPFGQANMTHHFHLYEKAVDARKLNPPFHRSEWEKETVVKQKRRKMTVSPSDFADNKIVEGNEMEEDSPQTAENEGYLLDLYVCCQCSFYCISSDVIPGVIPVKYIDEFTRDKHDHPRIGSNGEATVLTGWETFITILENKLWKGENRPLPVNRKTFQNKMGWTPVVRQIFESLGFVCKTVPANSGDLSGDQQVLEQPSTDIVSAQGRQNRARLLRAWVEMSAWIIDFQRRFAPSLKLYNPHKLWVKIDVAREMYQSAIGAHPDQITRGILSQTIQMYNPLHQAWVGLGLTPNSYSWELLTFAYMAQCRCDPVSTPTYFTHLYNIITTMQEFGEIPPQELQTLVIEERARYRWTTNDLQSAAKTLGFGKDGPLDVDFEDDIEEEFIAEAWKSAIRTAWRDLENGTELQRNANDAFRILAEARGSAKLRKMWQEGRGKIMSPDRAYSTLEVPKETDDTMLLTVFSIRVQEQPSQESKMREALSMIAEIRNSERIRQFLSSGADPGEITVPTRGDIPRGLNQLGNTCYLNSLLQYFYTIKELREAVAPMANNDLKSLEDDKLTDDDLKRHRVGGRLVTRKEVIRSKKFISQLADLFWQLEYCETAAVTPTLQLAKLALTTSRDEEEEDEADKGGTDSSNDTDATLVEDAPPRPAVSEQSRSPVPSAGSVLGKRLRDGPKHGEMDVDGSDADKDASLIADYMASPSSLSFPRGEQSPDPLGNVSAKDLEGDVVMLDGPQVNESTEKPSIHQRKNSESVMMFGKQHDVSECMDNCMFQIETALLRFDGMGGSQEDKTSVVKRLFYGKIRQRLAVIPDDSKSRSSIHEKEDLFSHLPVNVGQDGFDIYDGLSGYFDDIVEYEGKKARMEVSLVDLPRLLQIQLQRVQFNRDTLQPYKSQAYVRFGETIYMDRFLDNADPQKKAKSKNIQGALNVCRERVRLLTEHAPFQTALGQTCSFLSKQDHLSLDIDDDLISQLGAEQDLVKAEIEELRARSSQLKEDLEAVWANDSEEAYELTSVFIHRGSSPSWGHYFFYSRHLPDEPDSWFKYNDSDVTVVSKDEVLADTTGSTANPYLLVFAKKGSEVVHTVKRFDPMSLEEALP